MGLKMCALPVFLYVVLTCALAAVSGASECSSGQYLDSSEGECKPCSSCPLNHIVRKPCTAIRDTVCGPFYEFEFFNQGPDSKFSDHLGPSTPESSSPSKEANRLPSQTKGPGVQTGQERWKKLCFALIGALAVLALLAIIYVLITQLKARRDSNKTITLSDVEDPVVYYDARLLQDPEFAGATISNFPADLRHIEAQLEKNKRKRFTHRIFRPGGGKFENGNEYVDNINHSRGPYLLASIPEQDSRPEVLGYVPVLPEHSRHSSTSTESSTVPIV